jgi:hypothetical protein
MSGSTLARETKYPSIDAINALTDVDRAWMAGFFDGEGSIGLYRKFKNGVFYAVSTRLTIAQTDKNILVPFLDAFGGALSLLDRPERKTSRHTQYWTWSCDNVSYAALFMQTIRPWLRHKGDEADILIDFLKNRYVYSLEHKGALIDQMAALKTRRSSHYSDERSAQIRAIQTGTE